MSGAVVEPNAGSDSSMIETTAVKDGDKWIINGTKIFITNGEFADVILFIAQTDKSKGLKGLVTFICEKDTPGFSSTPQKGGVSTRPGCFWLPALWDWHKVVSNPVSSMPRKGCSSEKPSAVIN